MYIYPASLAPGWQKREKGVARGPRQKGHAVHGRRVPRQSRRVFTLHSSRSTFFPNRKFQISLSTGERDIKTATPAGLSGPDTSCPRHLPLPPATSYSSQQVYQISSYQVFHLYIQHSLPSNQLLCFDPESDLDFQFLISKIFFFFLKKKKSLITSIVIIYSFGIQQESQFPSLLALF